MVMEREHSSAGRAMLSLAEYAELDDPDDGYVTELVRGAVVREPRLRHRHGEVQADRTFHLKAWAKDHGATVTVESGYVLSDEPPTVRGPDAAVMVAPRPERSDPHGWPRGAPDVVAEILSPSDASRAMHMKMLDYLEAGARPVWIVDPEARTVLVHRPDGSANLLREQETLSGEDILSDFSVALREVFDEPRGPE